MPQTHLTDTRFDSFALEAPILLGLADAGFDYCTPIQAETLPLALAGQDVAGQAQTGTGKTAAFLVAAMQRLLAFSSPACEAVADESTATAPSAMDSAAGRGIGADPASGPASLPQSVSKSKRRRDGSGRQPRVVILAPTRELAVQIHRDAELLGRHTGFRLGLVYGGTGYQQQREEAAAGVDILIGTPGRMIDYFKQRVFDFRSVEVVVLDEADRMFDLGFIKDIRFVLRRMPPPTKRLGLLFSATLSYRVTELAYEHMNHPRMIEVASEKVTADRVRQTCYMVANDEKVRLLIGLLRDFADARIMIFVNTKREGEWVWGFLEGNGLRSAMLSGDVPQKKRLSLLRRFQAGELPIMVATDVAARGLHIPGVTHVINYDLPEDAEDYVHRIGRTARAGEAGDAISFVCETYAFCLPDIESFIDAKIEVKPVLDTMLADIDYRSRIRVPRRPREQRGASSAGRGRSGRRPQQDRRAASRRRDDAPKPDGASVPTAVAAADGPPSAAVSSPMPDKVAGDQTGRPRRRRRRKPAVDGAPTV